MTVIVVLAAAPSSVPCALTVFWQLISPAQVSRAILHALQCPPHLLPSGSCLRVTVQQGGRVVLHDHGCDQDAPGDCAVNEQP